MINQIELSQFEVLRTCKIRNTQHPSSELLAHVNYPHISKQLLDIFPAAYPIINSNNLSSLLDLLSIEWEISWNH